MRQGETEESGRNEAFRSPVKGVEKLSEDRRDAYKEYVKAIEREEENGLNREFCTSVRRGHERDACLSA